MASRTGPLPLFLAALLSCQLCGESAQLHPSLCASGLEVGGDVALWVDCAGLDSRVTVSPKVFYAFTEAANLSLDGSVYQNRIVQVEYVCDSGGSPINATLSNTPFPTPSVTVLAPSTNYPITSTPTVTFAVEQSLDVGVRCTFSGCYHSVSIHLEGGPSVQKTFALKPTPCTLDFDDCRAGTDRCDINADCINTEGDYLCLCRKGFTGNGTECQNINECATHNHTCSNHANCNDTDGSFTCVCQEGYHGDGFLCTDIDECSMNGTKCGDKEVCVNADGSFHCSCINGYQRVSSSCIDIDECSEELHNCSAGSSCVNLEGSHTCVCGEGEGTQCIMGATLQLIGIAAILPVFFLLVVSIYICYLRKGRRLRLRLSSHKQEWLTNSPVTLKPVDLGFSPVDAEPSHNLLASVHSIFDSFQPRDPADLPLSCIEHTGMDSSRCAVFDAELCDYSASNGTTGVDCELDCESFAESEKSILHGSGVVDVDVSVAAANEGEEEGEEEKEEEEEDEEKEEEEEEERERKEDHSAHDALCHRTFQSPPPYLSSSLNPDSSMVASSLERPSIFGPPVTTVGVASCSRNTSGIGSITSDYVYSDNSQTPNCPQAGKRPTFAESSLYYSNYNTSSHSMSISSSSSPGNRQRVTRPPARELCRQDSGMGFDVEEEVAMDSADVEAVAPVFLPTSVSDDTPLCRSKGEFGPIPLQTSSVASGSRVSNGDGYVVSGSEFSESYVVSGSEFSEPYVVSGSETPGRVSDGYVTESLFSVPCLPVAQECHSHSQ